MDVIACNPDLSLSMTNINIKSLIKICQPYSDYCISLLSVYAFLLPLYSQNPFFRFVYPVALTLIPGLLLYFLIPSSIEEKSHRPGRVPECHPGMDNYYNMRYTAISFQRCHHQFSYKPGLNQQADLRQQEPQYLQMLRMFRNRYFSGEVSLTGSAVSVL